MGCILSVELNLFLASKSLLFNLNLKSNLSVCGLFKIPLSFKYLKNFYRIYLNLFLLI